VGEIGEVALNVTSWKRDPLAGGPAADDVIAGVEEFEAGGGERWAASSVAEHQSQA